MITPGPKPKDIPTVHSDGEGCRCERCADPEAYDKKINEIIEKVGWYVHYVFDDDSTPNEVNIHTHGLVEKYNHPDIQICFALPQKVAHGVLWAAVNQIADGVVFTTRKRFEHVLTDYDVVFANAVENGRPVLRMILPDKNNNFNTDPYYSQWEGTDSNPWS